MSEEYIDKNGVRQLVTDYGSWTSSDAVRAVPKPGIFNDRTQFVNPQSPVLTQPTGDTTQSPQVPFADYTTKVTPKDETFTPQLTDGSWQRFGIAFQAGVRNNPLMLAITEGAGSALNPVNFKPDVRYTKEALIRDIDKTRDEKGLTDEDTLALRNAQSSDEFQYILDKRLDMRIGQQAQGLNLGGNILGGTLPSLVLGGAIGRIATGIAPGAGKGAAVIAAIGEGTAELGAAKYAESKYAYDTDWTDALGYAGLGAVPFMKGGFGAGFLKKGYNAAKETVQTKGVNLNGLGEVNYNPKYTGQYSDNYRTSGVVDEGISGSPLEGYKYRQDSSLSGGILYKENPAGDMRVNGLGMDFTDSSIGGKAKSVVDVPPVEAVLKVGEDYRYNATDTLNNLEMAILESLDFYDELIGARKLYSDYASAIKDIDTQLDAGVTPDLETDLLKQREVLAQYSGGLVEPYKAKPKVESKVEAKSEPKSEPKPKPTPKVESKPTPKPEPVKVEPKVESKPEPKPEPKPKSEAKVKENKAKLKEYSSAVDKLEKQIASKEKAKSKSYSQSAIDKLNAEIKELKPDLAKARKNMKRAEERLGIVKEVVKVVKDIKEYEKAVGRAKGVIESLSKKDVTQEDVKKALAKAESILRDKEKALAKALNDK